MNRLLPIDALHDALALGPMLEALVARRGDTPLWQRPEEGPARTLAAVMADARALAAWLEAAGLRPADRIAVLTDNYESWALTALAAALGGLTLVPLPTTAMPAIQASLLVRSSPRALLMGPEAWTQLLPVFVQRRDPIPELLLVDRAVGPLPPGLHALEDALAFDMALAPASEDGPASGLAAPGPAAPPATPAALFYNNGSSGRAEAAAMGPDELRAALDILRSSPELGREVDDGGLHGVLRCPMTAAGFLFDLWRPLVLGARILDLSGLRGDPPALRAAIARHRPVALSLARDDVGAALLAAPPERPAAAGLERLLPLAARLGRLIRGAPAHGVKAAWFFHDVPDASTLRGLREVGVTAIRTYQVSESAALCGLAPEHASTGPSGLAGSRSDGPVPTGYRVPAGVSVQILDPSRDGVGEIAIGGPAVASEALDASRSLVALPRVEGHLPTGDVGRVDAAGRLHVLGTQTFALRSAATTLTGEQVAAHYDGGPWEAFVAVPERLLWPEEVPGSWRWVAILHGAEQAVARRFLLARGAVVPEALRVHGFVCSPAAFPLGTHGRLRREALLGALRSAFAAHGSTEAERARIIDWLPSPATAGALP